MVNGAIPNHKEDDIEYGADGDVGAVRGLRGGFAASLGGLTALCLILLSIFGEYSPNLTDEHVTRYYHYLSGQFSLAFSFFSIFAGLLVKSTLLHISANGYRQFGRM